MEFWLLHRCLFVTCMAFLQPTVSCFRQLFPSSFKKNINTSLICPKLFWVFDISCIFWGKSSLFWPQLFDTHFLSHLEQLTLQPPEFLIHVMTKDSDKCYVEPVPSSYAWVWKFPQCCTWKQIREEGDNMLILHLIYAKRTPLSSTPHSIVWPDVMILHYCDKSGGCL